MGTPSVNNAVYDGLGDRWYTAEDDPVALLRAESRARLPWVLERIRESAPASASRPGSVRVLDVGCGAGFLANPLAVEGYAVTALDASEASIKVARARDATGRVRYELGDALPLPYPSGAFDVICAMDFLEHIERPRDFIHEVGRVLGAGGLFLFHTFNRNWVSGLVVIKGLEWVIPRTPKNLHVLRLFLKPGEIGDWCAEAGFASPAFVGLAPRVFCRPFWRMVLKGRVSDDFSFRICESLLMGYSGSAVKNH